MPDSTLTVPVLFRAALMVVVPLPVDLVRVPWLLKVAHARDVIVGVDANGVLYVKGGTAEVVDDSVVACLQGGIGSAAG